MIPIEFPYEVLTQDSENIQQIAESISDFITVYTETQEANAEKTAIITDMQQSLTALLESHTELIQLQQYLLLILSVIMAVMFVLVFATAWGKN